MSSDYSYIRVYVCFAFLGPEAWVCPRYQSDSAASSPIRECGNDVLITQQQQQQVEPDSLTKMIEGHQTHRPFLFPESGIASGCASAWITVNTVNMQSILSYRVLPKGA